MTIEIATTATIANTAATIATIAAKGDDCDDAYPGIVARLNAGWRVIAAPDSRQWILQRQRGAHQSADDWRARSHCRMRHALENVIQLYVTGDVDPAALAIIAALPGNILWPASIVPQHQIEQGHLQTRTILDVDSRPLPSPIARGS